jgi:hypothetical protein
MYQLVYKIAQNTAGTPPKFGDDIHELFYKIAKNTAGTSPGFGERMYDLLYKIAGNFGGSPVFGDGVYNLLLKTAGGGGAVAPPSPLLTGLVAYWKLDEASGSRADSSGNGSTLSLAAGAVPSRVGRVGNGADFVPGNWLTCASNPNIVMGDIDFTIAGWLWFDTLASQNPLEKNDGTYIDYVIYGTPAGEYGAIVASPSGSVLIQTPPGVAANTWHFVVLQHDATTHTLSLSRDNGVGSASASTAGKPPYVTTGSLTIGAGRGGGYGFDGIIDEIGIWKRLLTPAEITQLYNGGVGLTYPFTP